MSSANRVVPFDSECQERDASSEENEGKGGEGDSAPEKVVEPRCEAELVGKAKRESILPRVALVCVAVVCCSFAAYATLTGRLQEWMKALEVVPYPLVFVILVVVIIFMNMPFGYGYSVVVFGSGFGFGWRGAPPVLLGGLLIGPWLARIVNSRLVFRDQSPGELVRSIPNAAMKRLVAAVLLGIQRDRCSVLIVAATRCSPLAVGLQLIVLSAAAPPFWSFTVGMVVGGLPDLLAAIYMGKLARSVADQATETVDNGDTGNVKMILLVAQILACVLLMGLVSFAARRMLKKYDTQEVDQAAA